MEHVIRFIARFIKAHCNIIDLIKHAIDNGENASLHKFLSLSSIDKIC